MWIGVVAVASRFARLAVTPAKDVLSPQSLSYTQEPDLINPV